MTFEVKRIEQRDSRHGLVAASAQIEISPRQAAELGLALVKAIDWNTLRGLIGATVK